MKISARWIRQKPSLIVVMILAFSFGQDSAPEILAEINSRLPALQIRSSSGMVYHFDCAGLLFRKCLFRA